MVTLLEYNFPYGSEKQTFYISDDRDVTLLDPELELPEKLEEPHTILIEAINNPYKTETLEKLAEGKKNVVIVCDDYTRKLATSDILEVIIPVLNQASINNENISVLLGTGTHRPAIESEKKKIMGLYYKKIMCLSHNCTSPDLEKVGTTPRGNDVWINSRYVEADLKIVLNDVGLHYYAGLGGGRKSLLPGIAGKETIKFNHAFLLDENAAVGNIKDNPVSLDMQAAVELKPIVPDFAISVIQDNHRIIHAAAGDLNHAFNAMASKSKAYFLREAPQKAPFDLLIVGASGLPKDLNIYQATKAIEHTKSLIKDDGVVIFVAQAPDGIGNEKFENTLKTYDTLKEIRDKVSSDFVMGEHKTFYWYQALDRAEHYLVTDIDKTHVKQLLKARTFVSLQKAFDTVVHDLSNDISIALVPNGAIFAYV